MQEAFGKMQLKRLFLNTLTVTQLNEQIKSLLDSTFSHIFLEGEIGSVTYHTSGHIYFNIKDAKSSIKCVMFRSNANNLKFRLEAGQKIIINGSLSVYTPRGEYQLYAVSIEPYGAGALAVAFEQLKEKLQQKGYFENKKEIPKHIKEIAIVTSKSGAAIADMLTVIEKRWPLIKVRIIDTLVQGAASASEIAKHIKLADNLGVDLIIVGRGGGSVEDLWCFNEEIVADAIYEAKTPIVSAVGHEVDVMISDMVADLRAPTPSAAIEMILPDKKDYLFAIDEALQQYNKAIGYKVERLEDKILQMQREFKRYNPKNRLQRVMEEISSIGHSYTKVISQKMQFFENEVQGLQKQYLLSNPKERIAKNSAFVVQNGEKATLSKIKVDEKFILEDSEISMKVQCLDKKMLS